MSQAENIATLPPLITFYCASVSKRQIYTFPVARIPILTKIQSNNLLQMHGPPSRHDQKWQSSEMYQKYHVLLAKSGDRLVRLIRAARLAAIISFAA